MEYDKNIITNEMFNSKMKNKEDMFLMCVKKEKKYQTIKRILKNYPDIRGKIYGKFSEDQTSDFFYEIEDNESFKNKYGIELPCLFYIHKGEINSIISLINIKKKYRR